MESLFDFDAIRKLIAGGFRVVFDAMSAVTGLCQGDHRKRLGAPKGSVMKLHTAARLRRPSSGPNLVHAEPLYETMMAPDAPIFGAHPDVDAATGI